MYSEENGSNKQSVNRDEGNVWVGIGIGFLIYFIPSLFTIFGLFPIAFIAPIIHVAVSSTFSPRIRR